MVGQQEYGGRETAGSQAAVQKITQFHSSVKKCLDTSGDRILNKVCTLY